MQHVNDDRRWQRVRDSPWVTSHNSYPKVGGVKVLYGDSLSVMEIVIGAPKHAAAGRERVRLNQSKVSTGVHYLFSIGSRGTPDRGLAIAVNGLPTRHSTSQVLYCSMLKVADV